MNFDVGKVPCAPLGRGDMEFSYQGESLGGHPSPSTLSPLGTKSHLNSPINEKTVEKGSKYLSAHSGFWIEG